MLPTPKLPSACLCGLWSCSLQYGWSLREWQWIPTYTSSIWWAGFGIDLIWLLTLVVWACRLPPLAAQGKEVACPLSHTSPPSALFPPSAAGNILTALSWQILYRAVLISKAGREGSFLSRTSECESLCSSLTTHGCPCTGKPVLEMKKLKKIHFLNCYLQRLRM